MQPLIWGFLALSALSFASPTTNSRVRRAESIFGCVAGPEFYQKVIFDSGVHRYDMFVPFDSTPHTIGGVDSPELSCVDESVSGGPCTSCDVKVDHIQILNPGVCEVTIKDDAGTVRTFTIGGASEQLFFGTPGHPGRITCWPPHAPNLTDREASSGSLCPETGSSNVTFGVGSQKYVMTVPADHKTYSTQDPDEQLRWAGPLGHKYSMCLPCDQEVTSFEASQAAMNCKICLFGSENSDIWVSHENSPFVLDPPGEILNITCGWMYTDLNFPYPPGPPGAASVSRRQSSTSSRLSEIASIACKKTQGDILIRTWMKGSEYHTYVAPGADWRFWQTQNTETGSIPVATDQHVTSSRCMNCSAHIDAVLVEESPNAYCAAIRQGPNDVQQVTEVFHIGERRTFDTNDGRFIVAVSCFLHPTQKEENNHAAADAASASDIARRAGTELSLPWTLNKIREADLADTTCSSSGYSFAVHGVDGDIYFPPVPLDSEVHWMKDMHCVRLSDLECTPCDQIGAAQGVSAKVHFGPCSILTEDQREFHTPYMVSSPDNTNITPNTPVDPPAVISRIECGIA